MPATAPTPDLVLDPMFDVLLTPESAEQVVGYCLPDAVGRRIEALGERASDGALTPDGRREYEGLIHATDLVALFKAKARRPLGRPRTPTRTPNFAFDTVLR